MSRKSPGVSPIQPLTTPFDQQRLEDMGFLTAMTMSLLGNYAQTGHYGGPLAYTPYNIAVHLAGPEFGGLRYDYRRPKHPACDKFMLAGGHCIPTCYALWIANQVLGGGMSSRLFQEIRETRGLAYSVFSSPSSYSDTGSVVVYAGTALARGKVFDDIECDLRHRHHHKLGEAFHRVQHERTVAAVPGRNEDLSLIVGIDQTDQIAEHDAVFVAETGARQDDGGVTRIIEMNGDAGGYQFGLPGCERHRLVDAGAQVKSGRAGCRILGQLIAHARIENFDVEFFHG